MRNVKKSLTGRAKPKIVAPIETPGNYALAYSRYHKALGSRQELAVGTQSFIVGNPSSTASKAKVRAIKNQAVYLVGKDTVVSEGLKISMRPPLEPTSQSASTEQL